jgi:hypothetical protein
VLSLGLYDEEFAFMRICVARTGRVGLVIGTVFADLGNQVIADAKRRAIGVAYRQSRLMGHSKLYTKPNSVLIGVSLQEIRAAAGALPQKGVAPKQAHARSARM